VFLFNYLGYTFFVSLGIVFVALVINLINAIVIEKLESQYFAAKDKRMDATNEALSNIKCIKMFSWNNIFKEKILAARKLEF
jgi:small-conductance mechanosensitive channel